MVDIIKNNFSSGEIAPILNSRGDVILYQNGAKELLNVVPLVEGGVKKRDGTSVIFSNTVNNYVRLISFSPSSDKPFLLIMGVAKVLIYDVTTGDTTLLAFDTPYATIEDVKEVQHIYSNYGMYFTHEKYPVQLLKTDSNFLSWSWSALNFSVAPLSSNKDSFTFAAYPSGKEIGSYLTITIQNEAWSDTVDYIAGDVVSYGITYYQAIVANSNQLPTNTDYWIVVGVAEALNVFSPSNIGDIITINGGLVLITRFISSTIVGGIVQKALNSTIVAIGHSWTVSKSAFNATDGYPRCCSFFKQRLVLANTKAQPNTIWFSRVGDPENFLETTNDGDALTIVPASDRSDSILHLVQTNGGVAVLTGGAEFFIKSDGVFSPTTAQVNDNTFWGAFSDFRPTRVGNEVLFAQRGGMRVRAMSYRYEVDGLISPDLSASSAHIGRGHSGFYESAYQQEPNSVVWLIMGDGSLSSITINRDQEVVAWARHQLSGEVISIVNIPSLLGLDRLFALVRHNSTIAMVEIKEGSLIDDEKSYLNAVTSDYKLTFNHAPWLSNNEDIKVYSKVNGVPCEVKVISVSGTTLQLIEDNYTDVELFVGKKFNAKISLLPPELSQTPTSSRDSKASVKRITATVYQSIGLKVNGNVVDDIQFNDNPLAAVSPFNRNVKISEHGWSDMTDFSVVIEHDYALPFHLQAVLLRLEVNQN